MRPFTVLVGKAAPLPAANVDTDVIIRIDRLTGADWSQIGRYAFESLRYDAEGREEAAFVLNQPAYRGAPILVAGTNFGCGSSREPAVTAILAAGIRCVIADSFGDIFYANCFRNGLLPVRLASEDVDALSRAATAEAGPMTIDLAVQTIVAPDGRLFAFDVDRQSKAMLLEGLDEIGLTLKDAPAIAGWQAADRIARPWVWLDDAPAPTRPLTGGNNGSMGDDGHA